jgi:hypothetical protein
MTALDLDGLARLQAHLTEIAAEAAHHLSVRAGSGDPTVCSVMRAPPTSTARGCPMANPMAGEMAGPMAGEMAGPMAGEMA